MSDLNGTNHKNGLRNRRKILVVGDKGFFAESVINHSIHLAERLGYDLVALSVDVQCEGKRVREQCGIDQEIIRDGKWPTGFIAAR